MIWLESPPWARWIAAFTIAVVAVWIEVRPDPTVPHPFAIEDILPGTVIDETNTETRSVPSGVLAPVDLGDTALRVISQGDPVLFSDVGGPGTNVPAGWWIVEIALPRGARGGDQSRIVLLDEGDVVSGVVVAGADDDPLGSSQGMVAVEPEHAAEVARAAAEGRVVVMIAPP